MSVGNDYLLKKGDGPSAPKLFLDTVIVPAIVNALGAAEVSLDRAALRLGVRPSAILGGGTALAGLAALATLRSRNR